jgi:hypothetical protein
MLKYPLSAPLKLKSYCESGQGSDLGLTLGSQGWSNTKSDIIFGILGSELVRELNLRKSVKVDKLPLPCPGDLGPGPQIQGRV